MTYAAKTWVSCENSRIEIERTLTRYGAQSFAYGWQGGKAMIMFTLANRQIRFLLPIPEKANFEMTSNGRARSQSSAIAAWEQAGRSRWRALALCIKAKLEACESGITTIEDEFLAQTVLPDGSTVGSWSRPALDAAYKDGKMPLALGMSKP